MSKKAVWYKITTEKSILVEIDSEAQAEIIAELNQDTERNAKIHKRDAARILSLDYLCEDLGMDFADDSLSACEMIIENDEQRARRKKLEHVMSKLTPEQYRVVKLYYYEGYTQPEIASITGCTKVNVSRILSRGLVRMRKILEKKSDFFSKNG